MSEQNKWERVSGNQEEAERIYRKSRSFMSDVWFRFRRKPTALLGFILVLILLVFCLAGPYFTPYTYSEQNNKMASIPPLLTVYPGPEDGSYLYITQGLKLIEVDREGNLVRQLKKKKDDSKEKRTSFTWDDDTLVFLDYSRLPNTVLDAEGNRIETSEKKWNHTYLLGTDQLGRDILTRLMYGTRISLMVAFIAALVNMVIGIAYGGISGYLGGRTDTVMMRIVDIISTIPLTLYVILIKMCLDDGLLSIIIALSSVYWVDMARVVRGEMLSLKNQEFVLAARTIGSSTKTILLNHLIPNAMGPILVTVTMLIPSAIFMEAFMSFIGIGIAPPMASLGTMCNDATETLRTNPYQLFLPALVICIIMFAFNFVGDGLRDALDPKLKK
ncbi:MAG: ABC transporter permease [Oscillospiraceae bacterium]|nr:ABC transporter permease [Oscillospiraceae bacterium]MBQ5521367.1 ABC transporter permease [Oscillospiraceae bacterium]